MSNLMEFVDSKTWFLMLLSFVIVIAYFVFLFTGNENTSNVQTFFNLVMGFWFGTGGAVIGTNNAIRSYSAGVKP